MWSMILKKVASIGLKTGAKYLVMAVAGTVLIWMWQDYQGLRNENAALAAQRGQIADIHRVEMEKAHRVRERMQAALDLQKTIAAERMASNRKLSRQVLDLRKVERPDHEKKCPVHPAIVYAFSQLRGKIPGSSDTD